MPKLYTRNTWQDEVLAGAEAYNISGSAVNYSSVRIDLSTGMNVTGTLVNATRMNNIENGIDTLDNNMLSGTFTPYGYASASSGQLTYITGSSYRVEAGSMIVNGILLTWASPITRTGLSLTSGTMNYVYLYASGTTSALEESTTVPVWDGSLNYYKKTGDATRRCIGFLQASTVNTIRMFVNTVRERQSEFWYVDGDTASTVKAPITSSNSFATGTVWGQVDLSNSVPVHTTDVLIVAKEIYAGATDEAVLGVSPWDMGSGAASSAPYQVRGRTNNAASNNFPGNTWITVISQQKIWYKILTINGNPRAQIEVHGARIIR